MTLTVERPQASVVAQDAPQPQVPPEEGECPRSAGTA